MIHDERPVHCYSLDLNDGSVREITLRGRWEGSGREFVVYAKTPLEDSYVVVCRRNEFIGIGASCFSILVSSRRSRVCLIS